MILVMWDKIRCSKVTGICSSLLVDVRQQVTDTGIHRSPLLGVRRFTVYLVYPVLGQPLLEAVAIDRGEMPLVEREDMPAKTMFSAELKEKELINQLCEIRKQKKITQEQLAEMTGNKQQAISRAENNMHSPSLRLFCNMVNALGYEIEIVKKGSVQNTK